MNSVPKSGMPQAPFLWTRGVAARETLNYLDKRGGDAEPLLSTAELSRRQLQQDPGGVSVVSQHRFLELAAIQMGQAALIANQLGMSERSLRRGLAEEGTNFGEILDRVKQRLARRYLEDDRVSLQQTAWLLGYSEIGAFNHAFKRWTGTSPGRARQSSFSKRRETAARTI